MDADTSEALRTLLLGQQVAALATLHRGEPATSMVPYALLPEAPALLIHVSRLAPHTADMQDHPQVSLLVMAPPGQAATPQELPRVSLQGQALPLHPEHPAYSAARQRYLNRFPGSEPMFGFADFTLMRIDVDTVRFVAGFGRAHAVPAAELARLLSTAPSAH